MRVSLTTLALVAVTLATTAVAQIRFTSPRGFLSKEGADMCHLMGALEYGRHDILDGEHRGKPFVMKELAFRADYRQHFAGGRTWANAGLRMAECDMPKYEVAFSKVATSWQLRHPNRSGELLRRAAGDANHELSSRQRTSTRNPRG